MRLRSRKTTARAFVLLLGVSVIVGIVMVRGADGADTCPGEVERLVAVRDATADYRLSHDELSALEALDCPQWLGPFWLDRLVQMTEGPEGDRHWGYFRRLWNEATAQRLLESPYESDRLVLWAFVRAGEPAWTVPFLETLRADQSPALAAARDAIPESRVGTDVFELWLIEVLMTHPDASTRLFTLAVLGPGIVRSDAHLSLLNRWAEQETDPDVRALLTRYLEGDAFR